MKATFPPNSWRVGIVSLIGAGILAFIHSRPILEWAYADIAATSAEYRQSVLTVGMFMAAMAAWVGSSIAQPTNAHAPPGAVRRGAPLVFSNVSYLCLAGGVGFTLGLAPATWHVALSRVYGSFDLATIASGYAALFAYISAGYLIGCLVPNYLAIPIALGMAYVMAFFTSSVISPVFDFDVLSGLEVPTQVSVVRLLYFLACIGGAAIAASAWLAMRSTNDVRFAATGVAIVLVPLAVLTYAAGSYSNPLVVADNAKPVCEKADSSTVCLHPARAELLSDIADSVEVMGREAGSVIFPQALVFDATLAAPASEQSSGYSLQIQGHSDEWLLFARSDIASYAAGIGACYRGGYPDARAQDFSSAVAGWILSLLGDSPRYVVGSPGAEEQLKILTGLDAADVKSELEPLMPQVRQCAARQIE